ncbi:MAG: hypothetical protein JXA14_08765 [Anaerolineae bacterium]|nr:hypothetical protein [Anaerolineae bacterium]
MDESSSQHRALNRIGVVMRKWVGFVSFGLSVLLFACRAEERSFATTPSVEAVMATVTSPSGAATETFVPAPSATLTQLATATALVIPTATSASPLMPIVRVEGVMADGTCVELDDTVAISDEVFRWPDFENEVELYLNAGGSISGLPGALASTDVSRAIRIQLVSQDVTGSGIPDLFIGVTLPYENGDGETHLLFFTCVGEQYEGEVVFRRAGAGSRMEGLYEGGGVDVRAVRDMNGNGRVEVFFSVNWPGYGEHYLLEWERGQFVSLIEYQGILGESRNWIETYEEEIGIIDVDGNGVYEIVVGEEGDEVGGRQSIWRWNGERYSLDQE